jgi:hypothetical protein
MTSYTCNQKGCPVSQGGSCLEGFSLVSECPHSRGQRTSNKKQDEQRTIVSEEASAFNFHSGEALSYEEGSVILKRNGAKIVAIVGAQFSGKTTLLSRIYEEFEKGCFSGFRFSGSKTLLEFSRRCWMASCGSMRTKPDTERTKEWETDRLIHLQVQRYPSTTEDLLIADISGETYKNATSSLEAIRKLRILKRADQVVLFLDCAKLMDHGQRALVESKACSFLRMGIQEGLLGAFSSLTIVLSKLDKVGDPETRKDDHAYVESVVDRVKSVATVIGEIRVRRIAARHDLSADWISNEDLARLFADWFDESNRTSLKHEASAVRTRGLRCMQTYRHDNNR